MSQETEQWTVVERKTVLGYKNISSTACSHYQGYYLISHQLKSLKKAKDERSPKKEAQTQGEKLSFATQPFTQHLGQTPLFLGFGREWVGG